MEQLEAHLRTEKMINRLLLTVGAYVGVILLTLNAYPSEMRIYFQILAVLLTIFFLVVLLLKSYLIKATANPKPAEQLTEEASKPKAE